MSFCFMRSSRRPGHATTMSTPARSACSCGRWLTPPKIVVTLRPVASARGMIVAAICVASSRVGARIRARGRPGVRRAADGAGEARDERERERDGLAGAGAAAAEHVAAGEGVGEGVALDRERLGLAVGGENGGEGLGHAEFEEGRHRDAFMKAHARRYALRCGRGATARDRASVRRSKRRQAQRAGIETSTQRHRGRNTHPSSVTRALPERPARAAEDAPRPAIRPR